ncbi:MAG TPA: HAMP domain-containing sensor histidine kinase [Thermoanaerobaculia bacterium]|nr:HAMP domain-containing sensor histidine kinase [Thermoanaerobaculia bacterium]
MAKQRKRAGKAKSDENPGREESLSQREDAVEAQEEHLRAEEQDRAGVLLELEALASALREANGHLVIANLRSQALAEQMNQLYEEAKTAIQAKDNFFALISHELRTPLTSITGWAALLQRAPDPPTIIEAARSIATSAALQAQLIDSLLDVSRIMTGNFTITETKIDLRRVMGDSLTAMRPLAAAKSLSLRTSVEQSIIVNGDPFRLGQAVSNLLANAIKFTPPGGLIETRLVREASFAVIEVCDTGEGIASHFLPNIFGRGSQATAGRFGGLGLGLSIVKHIVELHGGSVAAASAGEGKGATFTVRIPCAA